jgi:hypothetical protein
MWRQREGRLSAATEEHLQPGALRMHCCRHGTWRVLKTEADRQGGREEMDLSLLERGCGCRAQE